MSTSTSYPTNEHCVIIDKSDDAVTIKVYGPGVTYDYWAEPLKAYCTDNNLDDLSKTSVKFKTSGSTHTATIPIDASSREARTSGLSELS